MPSVLENLGGIALDTNVISTLTGSLTGLAGRVPGLPAADIQQIAGLAGQISLPNQQALFGDGIAQLATLVSGGLRSPEDLWAVFTNPLGQLEQTLGSGLQAPMTSAFDQLRAVADGVPQEPAALLGSITGPLQQVAALLAESPALQHVTAFIAHINAIGAQLGAAPAELAALLQEQLHAALNEATALVTPQIRQLDRFLEDLNGAIQVEALAARHQALLDRLAPAGGAAIADTIAALDFAADDAVATVDANLRAARLSLEDLGQEAARNLASAAALIPLFNVDAWTQRVASAATIAASAQVRDLASLLSSWQDILVQAQQLVANLSLESVLQQVRDLVGRIQPLLTQFDLAQIKTTLLQGIQAVSGLAATVRQAQIDVLTGLQSLANSITQAIDAIDLSLVTSAIDNALSAVDPVIGQIESLVDTVTSSLQTALTSVQVELSSLVTSLTDTAGEVRSAIEGFLNAISDAIPDNIPETLESVGQLIADAVAGLDEILLDPVFDAVVAELDDMRQQLQEIDVGSLNALLQAALAAALAIFQALDFPQEVEDFLIGEFDTAVEPLAEQAIDTIQVQVDGILGYLRSVDPAMLFDTLGITAAYDDMVAQLNGFRPSEALRPAIDQVREVADQLERFTPGQVLQPLLEPLQRLRQFLDGLSLEPIFAQLQQVLDRLNGLLAQLDITPFIDQLDQAMGRVRAQLSGLLTVDGLLDFLQPIHDAVMEALNAVDPAQLLQPLEDVRTVLLAAIDAVDLSALGDAFAAIAATVSNLQLPNLRTNFQSRVQAVTGGLDALDLPAKLNELRTTQRAVKQALESRGTQADAVAEERRQALLYTANAMDPLVLLADSVQRFRELQTSLGGLASALDQALRDGGALSQPLDALSGRLREIAGAIAEGASDIKQVLRDAVGQAYQAMGVGTINAIYQQVQETFQSFSPDSLETALNALVQPVRDWLDNLLDPSAVLGEVVEAFDSFKALIDPGLGDFLDQVRADVQPIVDAIVAKVSALDPSTVLNQLDARYQAIIAVKDRLVGKLESMLDTLDEPYQLILGLVDQMNPGTVLVEPLSATYQAILDKLAGVDIRLVFQPLLDAIRRLREALVAGIDRTATAFEAFLGAAPPVSAGAAVGI